MHVHPIKWETDAAGREHRENHDVHGYEGRDAMACDVVFACPFTSQAFVMPPRSDRLPLARQVGRYSRQVRD